MSRVSEAQPEARVRALIDAARRVADARDPVGRRARDTLPVATGLTVEGVEYALTHCLETEPSESEVRALCGAVSAAPRAHVLLSSNVFVAAHRAIAVALASSDRVEVRASRREPAMAALLNEAAPGLFRLVDELAPLPADHVWAYGRDATLAAVRGDLPGGVVLHPHGEGLGIAVVQAAESERDSLAQMRSLGRSLAHDVVAFDQRGCLSPRVALVLGNPAAARELAVCVAKELTALEHEVPRGEMSADERGDQTWYRDTMIYACELLAAGKGVVGCDVERQRLLVPPVGRNLHVVFIDDLAVTAAPFVNATAAVGVAGPNEAWEAVREVWPRARVSAIGKMQRPRFDGPVDRRPDPAGEVL